MIYSRFGNAVTLTRPVTTLEDVETLEKRKADKHDEERLSFGMYCAGRLEHDSNERLFDLGLLRADGGIAEINKTAREIGANPK